MGIIACSLLALRMQIFGSSISYTFQEIVNFLSHHLSSSPTIVRICPSPAPAVEEAKKFGLGGGDSANASAKRGGLLAACFGTDGNGGAKGKGGKTGASGAEGAPLQGGGGGGAVLDDDGNEIEMAEMQGAPL
jgi:hypothetical protein